MSENVVPTTSPVQPGRTVPAGYIHRLDPPGRPARGARLRALQRPAPRARQIMTPDPECCGPQDIVTRPAQIMARQRCGCVPVVETGTRRIVGIVTDRDLALRVIAARRDAGAVRVEEVMSRGVVCCFPDDDIEEIEQRMRTHRVRRIPVVDDGARVIGIVSQADLVVRAMREHDLADAEDVARTLEAVSLPTPAERL